MLEIISLIFSHFLSGAPDAHRDHYDSLTSGNIGQALHYLNIGRIPALIVLCILAGFFGLFGVLMQHAPVCLIFSIIGAHYTGKVIALWLPKDETNSLMPCAPQALSAALTCRR